MDLERYRVGVEYLVTLTLSGRKDVLRVFELYAEGLSTTEIARLLNISVYNVKSWIQKLYVYTHPAYAPLLVRRTLPLLKDVKPIMSGKTCLICNITFKTWASVSVHMVLRHRDLIRIHVEKILAKLGGADEPEGERN